MASCLTSKWKVVLMLRLLSTFQTTNGSKEGTTMMQTKAMIKREYNGYIALLSLLLGSLISSEAFLVSPSSRATVVSSPVEHPRQSKALQVANVPFFAATTETSATTEPKSEAAASVVVNQPQHQRGGSNNNNKNDKNNDEEDFKDENEVYARIGINKDALALGISPLDALKYIGSREDLIKKTMTDIPKMGRAQAEIEVDKFLLDADALSVFIEFKKRKEADPDFVVPKEEGGDEGLFSFRNVVFIYVAYVACSSGPIAIRKYVGEQVEAGSWKGTGIPQLDEWLLQTPPAAAASVADIASSSLSDATASTAAISMDTVMQAAQVVGDSLN